MKQLMGVTMSNYKGYLPGINPNYTKKILQDDDDRYFALDSGRFVNGLGQEVKTMKEAVACFVLMRN